MGALAVPDSNRSAIGRIGAHVSWANTTDRSARTAPARAALDRKFLDQAGGDPVRAEHLRKAHFARLALKSAQSRRKARELTESAERAETELASLGGSPPGDPRQSATGGTKCAEDADPACSVAGAA